MLLAIDIGNTQIAAGVFKGQELWLIGDFPARVREPRMRPGF